MKVQICKKYLVFPVNTAGEYKVLTFYKEDEEVYRLRIKLEDQKDKVNFNAYIEMSRFLGEELTLAAEPDMMIPFREADAIDKEGLYQEPLRPKAHFSTKNGWINDPNGLVYQNGVYHMFYQYNPAENHWENMHWGHAESTDLFHWEEKDIALYPDHTGTMFSGCGLVDEKNLLGLQTGDTKTLLLYYTTTTPFVQRLAYSTDNFKTVKPFREKEVVENFYESLNRDPKVVYAEDLGCYLMAIYLREDEFALLKSSDLVNWEKFFEFRIPGDYEFPDILKFEDEGVLRYVITSCHDFYIVGHFEEGRFIIDQDVRCLQVDTIAQAGQAISNMPDDRCVRIIWLRWPDFGQSFCGQMSLPAEYNMEKIKGEYYLSALPIKEIDTLVASEKTFANQFVGKGDTFNVDLSASPYWLRLQGDVLAAGRVFVTLFGRTLTIDFDKNLVEYGGTACPITVVGEKLDIVAVIDTVGAEIFADKGRVYFASINAQTIQDYSRSFCEIKSTVDYTFDTIEIKELKSIW